MKRRFGGDAICRAGSLESWDLWYDSRCCGLRPRDIQADGFYPHPSPLPWRERELGSQDVLLNSFRGAVVIYIWNDCGCQRQQFVWGSLHGDRVACGAEHG